MAKIPEILYEVKVDDTEARRKIETIIRAGEKLSEIIKKNSNINIEFSVVNKSKKWYQFWR